MTLPFINATWNQFFSIDTSVLLFPVNASHKNGKKDWLISENSIDEHQYYEKNIMKYDCIPIREIKFTYKKFKT